MQQRTVLTSHSRQRPIAAAVHFALAGLLAAGWPMVAVADTAAPAARHYDISAGPLDQALSRFALQAGVALSFEAGTLKGLQTPGLKGGYGVEEGFAMLLRGSGYAVSKTPAGYVLAPVPTVHSGHKPVSMEGVAELAPMVVTATKTETSIRDVPFAVSVITAESIRQQSAQDITDVLRREAGVDVNRSSPAGVATVSIRGGDSGVQRTQVLIDGQPSELITTGVGGRTAIQLVDLANVERVEIVRGAGSALYGPSGVGGVVNVITKRGNPDKPETRFFAGIDDLGSNQVGFSSSGGNKASGFDYQVNGKHASYGGYKPSPVPSGINYSINDIGDRENALGGRLGWRLTDRNDLSVTFNGNDTKANLMGRPAYDFSVTNRVLGIESNNWLTDNYLLSVAVSQRAHRGEYGWDSYFSGFSTSTTKNSTLKETGDKLAIDVKNQWDIAASHRLLFGVQYIKDDASMRYYNPTAGDSQVDDRGGSIKNLGLYVQDEMRFGDRWFVTAGLRHDRFDYDLHYIKYITAPVTNRTVDKSMQSTNPRLGARYRLAEATDLRASIGKAFRAPDTYGLMGSQLIPGVQDYRPNPDLAAERSVTADVGVDHDFGAGLKTSATIYHTEVKDAMVLTRTGAAPMVLQWGNLGKVVNEGLELEIKKRFGDAWQTYANYTHNVSRVASDPPAGAMNWPDKDRKLPLSPVHKLAFGVAYKPSDMLVVRMDGRYASEMYVNGDTLNTAANRLPGYFVADVKATWYWKVGRDKADLSVGVRNLGDKQYSVKLVNTAYEEPRVVFLQLGYSL